MTSVRGMCVAVAVFSAFSSGCSLPETDASYLDDPLYSTMSANGNGTTNKLNVEDFHLNAEELRLAAASALARPDPKSKSPRWLLASNAHIDNLMSTFGGQNVLRYAVRCALGDGTYVYFGQRFYTGLGLMAGTAHWLQEPLTKAETEDLFSCLLAHLNPEGVQVPIALSGPTVINDPTFNATLFTFDEALWVTEILEDTGAMSFHVWPLQDLKGSCDIPQLTPTLKTRTCGTNDGACGVQVHPEDPEESGCTEGSTGWYCNGRPAVKTRLNPVHVTILHVCDSPLE